VDLQRLPLPVGSPHPVRRSLPASRAVARPATAVLGVLAALAGGALGAAPPAVTVGMDAGAYRVGDAVLPARGAGVYAGPQGAVVVAGPRAAGATRLNGVRAVGSCVLAAGAHSERCTFDVGGRTLTAVDRLDRGGWERRYGDGRTARIELGAGRPVPVPIPLGR